MQVSIQCPGCSKPVGPEGVGCQGCGRPLTREDRELLIARLEASNEEFLEARKAVRWGLFACLVLGLVTFLIAALPLLLAPDESTVGPGLLIGASLLVLSIVGRRAPGSAGGALALAILICGASFFVRTFGEVPHWLIGVLGLGNVLILLTTIVAVVLMVRGVRATDMTERYFRDPPRPGG
jgi:hypothetical protein